MEYAIDNYSYQDVYQDVELPEILVEHGVPKSERIFDEAYATLKIEAKDSNFQMLLRSDEEVDVKTEYSEHLEAPVHYGKEIGRVSYYLKGEKIEEYPIIVAEDVVKKDLAWYLERIAKMYFANCD